MVTFECRLPPLQTATWLFCLVLAESSVVLRMTHPGILTFDLWLSHVNTGWHGSSKTHQGASTLDPWLGHVNTGCHESPKMHHGTLASMYLVVLVNLCVNTVGTVQVIRIDFLGNNGHESRLCISIV